MHREESTMKKGSWVFCGLFFSLLSSGCIVTGSPGEDPVYVFPGASKIFTAYTFADHGDLVWTLDDVQVQAGGNTFEYTAPDNSTTFQTLKAHLTNALGNDTYVWNITTNAEVVAGSPNNPHVPSGPGPWFEGWYTRVSDVGGSRSIAIIVASALPQGQYYTPGQYYPGKINVLISEGDGAPTYSYTIYPEQTMALVDGEPVSTNPVPYSIADFEWLAEGFGTVTEDSVVVSIPGVVDVNVQTENRLPFNIFDPEIGPYAGLDALPLPLRWWIHSLGSDATYQYTVHSGDNAGTYSGTGYTHLEKNWGAAFPLGWIWTQGIATDNEAQFVMSTAEVDFDLFILDTYIGAFRSPNVNWDYIFSMPELTFIREHDGCAGTFRFEIMDPTLDRHLIFDASTPPESFGYVSTPSPTGFEPETGVESFSATVDVWAYQGGTLLDHQIFYNAALEFGTGWACLD